MINKALIALFIILLVPSTSQAQKRAKEYSLNIEETFTHDRRAYTQGLFFYDGQMYETTGQYGESSLRKVDYKSGKYSSFVPIDRKYFIEGSCVLNGQMYVLTWQENVCFVYDIKTFRKLGELRNPYEGWGLTTDGSLLIMSDGTNILRFMDSMTFMERKKIEVTLNGRSVSYLNELEYINGKIWANVYTSDYILIIDPATGVVEGRVDCRNLLSESLKRNDTDVFNGIAWDSNTNSIYLTGKNWPRLYRISLKEKK